MGGSAVGQVGSPTPNPSGVDVPNEQCQDGARATAEDCRAGGNARAGQDHRPTEIVRTRATVTRGVSMAPAEIVIGRDRLSWPGIAHSASARLGSG
jgi:hypothetical protein